MMAEAGGEAPGFPATDESGRYNSVSRLVITLPGSNGDGTITVSVS